jgi:tryptophanyl-tRNA synthetase
LGNYLGAIRPFVRLQHLRAQRHEAAFERLYFCVVDLHSLTTLASADRESLRERTRVLAATALACGVAPNAFDGEQGNRDSESLLFVQSMVPQHAELMWILACHTPAHLLNAMIQWKEKRKQVGSALGLYAYPVLMAADVLLYGATHVPVGDDQAQHVELMRKLAASFNGRFGGGDVLAMPRALVPTAGRGAARVMSLRDGRAKMSKSNASAASRIHLTDSADDIQEKLRRAKTDSLGTLTYEPERRPELANLLGIYAQLDNIDRCGGDDNSDNGDDMHALAARFDSFSQLKTALGERIIEHVTPIGARIDRLLSDGGTELDSYLQRSSTEAQLVASARLSRIKKVIDLYQ